jgi:hypothetical protein
MNTKIRSLHISNNPTGSRDKKRLLARFYLTNGKEKVKKFGSYAARGGTFADGASVEKKENYLKRHKKNEDWGNIMTAGALSRYVLWSKRTDKDITDEIRKRFNIQGVSINFRRY